MALLPQLRMFVRLTTVGYWLEGSKYTELSLGRSRERWNYKASTCQRSSEGAAIALAILTVST